MPEVLLLLPLMWATVELAPESGAEEAAELLLQLCPCNCIPAVQAASDVYSPISGEVVEINSALVDEPAKVRQAVLCGPISCCYLCWTAVCGT